MTQDFAGAPEKEGAEALQLAAQAAERAGALVRALALPDIAGEAWRIQPTIQHFEAHRSFAWEYRENYRRDAEAVARQARSDQGHHARRL